jgi:hypothetical protein
LGWWVFNDLGRRRRSCFVPVEEMKTVPV